MCSIGQFFAQAKKINRLLPILLLFSVLDLAGQISIRGKVLDKFSGLPVAAANVSTVDFEGLGTITDTAGVFILNLPSEKTTLIFSHIAYESEKIPVGEAMGKENTIFLIPRIVAAPGGITVTAARMPVSLSIPAPVAEIPREWLNRDRDLSITPVLNRIPGIFMHSGGLNTNRITIRGIGSRSPFATAKIKAYLNDIPLTSGVGETTLEDIDLSLIQDARVWKGPSASTYGAGLGGVLLFNLDSGKMDSLSSLGHKYTTGAFGLERHQTSLKVVDKLSRMKLHLNFNRTVQDGYRENSRYDRSGLGLVANWNWDVAAMTVFLNGIALRAFIPSSLNEQDFIENPEKAAFIWGAVRGFEDYDKRNIGINYQRHWDIQTRHRLSLSVSAFSGTYAAYESRPFNILREKSRIYGMRNVLEWQPGDKSGFSLKAGVEVFEEAYNWQTNRTISGVMDTLLSDDEELRSYYNLFAEMDRSIGNWKFSAGLNYNRTLYRLQDRFPSNGDQGGDYVFEPVLSPRLGIKYSLGESVGLFGTVSHGFSAPNLEETLNPEGQVNPDIRPERGWNMELGLRGIQWKERWSFDLSIFNMQIRDLLVAERTNFDQFIGKNAGRTTHRGLEFFFQHHFPVPRHQLDLGLGYTLADYRFREFTDKEVDYSGKRLPGVAPHVVNVLLDWLSPGGIFLNGSYQWVDAMPLRDDNVAYSERYELLHVKLGWRLELRKGWLLELSGGVENLLDEQYASMLLVNAAGSSPRYYYPGSPRNAFGSILLRKNW